MVLLNDFFKEERGTCLVFLELWCSTKLWKFSTSIVAYGFIETEVHSVQERFACLVLSRLQCDIYCLVHLQIFEAYYFKIPSRNIILTAYA